MVTYKVSKLKEIAERLIHEIRSEEEVKEVRADREGNVEVLGESEFILKTNDGKQEKVKLPSTLPARTGKTAFRKLDKEISDSGFSVEDPDTLLDAKDYLINQMLQNAGKNLSADDLTMESYNQVGNYYWEKVVQAEKKSKS